MTLLLELNDLSVRCFQDGQLLWQSAGVAVVDPALGQPLFGSAAWRESRKKPLHTYTQFWSQLNTEPLPINHPQVRHHGDLAYLHLRHIESQLPLSFADQEVVFALPAALPREALSLLLGIANQCGLKTLSFVDSGLASMRDHGRTPTFTHVEMSLHHCVLTELQLSGNTLERSHSELLHDQGWFNLHTQLLNYFSELFIRQTRFNPRHGAGTEQQLFDAIPNWLRQSASLERNGMSTFQCELEQNSVQVDIAPLRQFVQSVWQPLQNKLAHTSHLYLGDRLAECMPLLNLPADTVPLNVQQLTTDLSQLAQDFSAHPAGVRFINSLPRRAEADFSPEAPISSPPANPAIATHILYQHSVWPLQGPCSVTPQQQMVKGISEAALLSIYHGQIQAHQGQLQLNGAPLGQTLTLNTPPLVPGDRLTLCLRKEQANDDLVLTLVRVEDVLVED